ncbi:hypothetical protein VTO73DRAFT_10097 [Trametes versicolor]
MSSLALRPVLGATSRSCRARPSPTHVFVWRTCRSLSTPAPHEPAPHSNAPNPGPALLSANASSFPPSLKSTGAPGSSNSGKAHHGELSDQEWEIRIGRGIYILQQTLPTFFSTGLISSVDTSSGHNTNSRAKDDSEDTTIYSPNIRLTYRPPTPFPPPLQIEGISLYLASSVLLRHALNALYTDLRVELQRVRVHGPRSSSTSGLSAEEPRTEPTSQTRSIREKSLFVNFSVRGTNRVSKAEAGWEVNSTYTFSPVTGLIHLHAIDSIHPAPHQAFFDALQAALNKIGLGRSSDPREGAGAGGMARTSSRPPAPDRS